MHWAGFGAIFFGAILAGPSWGYFSPNSRPECTESLRLFFERQSLPDPKNPNTQKEIIRIREVFKNDLKKSGQKVFLVHGASIESLWKALESGIWPTGFPESKFFYVYGNSQIPKEHWPQNSIPILEGSTERNWAPLKQAVIEALPYAERNAWSSRFFRNFERVGLSSGNLRQGLPINSDFFSLDFSTSDAMRVGEEISKSLEKLRLNIDIHTVRRWVWDAHQAKPLVVGFNSKIFDYVEIMPPTRFGGQDGFELKVKAPIPIGCLEGVHFSSSQQLDLILQKISKRFGIQ